MAPKTVVAHWDEHTNVYYRFKRELDLVRSNRLTNYR